MKKPHKPRVVGVEINDRWRYIGTCECGWHYNRWDAPWDLVLEIANGHAYLRRAGLVALSEALKGRSRDT
ncbi:hypothetical protein ACFY7C_19355 [Streptomyces sp. NPDC012769]|uniref:hypothetical protein n=1 Tax=Streptomyces sp. NPDC012769 TaxID=3364848 RepID=UPI0036B9C5C3